MELLKQVISMGVAIVLGSIFIDNDFVVGANTVAIKDYKDEFYKISECLRKSYRMLIRRCRWIVRRSSRETRMKLLDRYFGFYKI